MTMMFCEIRHTVYGCSGTELPPPVDSTERYIMLPYENETKEAFRERMFDLVEPYSRNEKRKPRKSYSENDTWSWRIVEVVERKLEEFKDET